VGTADLTHMAFVAAVAAHMGTPAEMRALVDTITRHPASMLRVADYGLAPGGRADLVVWDCERVDEIVARLPHRAVIVKGGRVTVVGEQKVHERWRTT
jgi:cytosine deaminase